MKLFLLNQLEYSVGPINLMQLLKLTGRVASGRGGSGAYSVVIQRNPCQINRNKKKKDLKNKIQVGTWNVRTILRPGKLTNVMRDEKSKLGCDGTSRDKMEGGGRHH